MRVLLGIVALLIALALVAPAASPVQLSYVTSDSMTPTIETNDGYVLVPAGSVESGEIITFYSAERGTYVTHRVVGVQADGFVTRGDANPSTDQAAGYPLVQRSEITGQVLTVGDSPLLVPRLGTALSLLRSYWYAVAVAVLGALLYGTASGSRSRRRDAVVRSRDVVVPAMVVAVLVGVALVSMAAVHQTQVYQVTADEAGDPDALTVGETRTESLTVRIAATPITHFVTETDGMRIAETGPADGEAGTDAAGYRVSSSRNVTVAIPAQEATGIHTASLDVYPYPATLPRTFVMGLHGIHPLVAALATVLVVVLPVYAFHWLLVDTTTPLRSTRHRVLRRLRGGR